LQFSRLNRSAFDAIDGHGQIETRLRETRRRNDDRRQRGAGHGGRIGGIGRGGQAWREGG
jgi:hypothetical protein